LWLFDTWRQGRLLWPAWPQYARVPLRVSTNHRPGGTIVPVELACALRGGT